jgi:hypothetical protein
MFPERIPELPSQPGTCRRRGLPAGSGRRQSRAPHPSLSALQGQREPAPPRRLSVRHEGSSAATTGQQVRQFTRQNLLPRHRKPSARLSRLSVGCRAHPTSPPGSGTPSPDQIAPPSAGCRPARTVRTPGGFPWGCGRRRWREKTRMSQWSRRSSGRGSRA